MNMKALFGPLGISLVSIVICVIAVVVQVPPLAGALIHPSARESQAIAQVDRLVEQNTEAAQLYEQRFEGRSPFFVPPPPQVPQRRTQGASETAPEPETRPAPDQYSGDLTPTSSLGNSIKFRRTQGGGEVEIRVGEEKEGHHVIAHNPPWSVTVEWTRPPEGHISYETGRYVLRFWKDSEEGPNAPLLKEAPPPGSRQQGLNAAAASGPREGFGTSTGNPTRDELIRQRARERRAYDDDDDEEDEED